MTELLRCSTAQLTESDVIAAVSSYLHREGWLIESSATTNERGN